MTIKYGNFQVLPEQDDAAIEVVVHAVRDLLERARDDEDTGTIDWSTFAVMTERAVVMDHLTLVVQIRAD